MHRASETIVVWWIRLRWRGGAQHTHHLLPFRTTMLGSSARPTRGRTTAHCRLPRVLVSAIAEAPVASECSCLDASTVAGEIGLGTSGQGGSRYRGAWPCARKAGTTSAPFAISEALGSCVSSLHTAGAGIACISTRRRTPGMTGVQTASAAQLFGRPVDAEVGRRHQHCDRSHPIDYQRTTKTSYLT